jgi:hypothetical protein
MQGVAAKQAHDRHEQPPEGSVAFDGQDRIVVTGSKKTAAGIEKRGYHDLVKPDQTDKTLFQDVFV